jgi:WD40 repeat protein
MSTITEIAWSPDGRFIALGNRSGPVEIWDVRTGKLLSSLTLSPAEAGTARSDYLAWSPDGRYIAAADASLGGQFAVWARDNWTQTLARQIPGSYSEIRGLAWSPDSKKLLITGDITPNNKVLGQALIWDIHTDTSLLTKQVGIGDSDGPLLDSGKGVSLALSEPTWSSDGRAFAIGVNQQALIFRASGQPLSKRGTYAPYGRHPTLAWSPTKTQRLAGILPPDSAIAVWNPFTNQLIHTYTHTQKADGMSCAPQSTAFVWSPNGKYIASTEENVVHVWSPE